MSPTAADANRRHPMSPSLGVRQTSGKTRFRCGRVGGVLAITMALLSAACILGCVWVIRRKRGIVQAHLPATCALKDVSYRGWVMCQYCHTGYTTSIQDGKERTVSRVRCKSSSFPCVVLSVLYQQEEGGPVHPGIIHDPTSGHAHLKQCSHSSCHPSVLENQKEIADFVDRWRTLPSSPCVYDSKNPHVVLDETFLEYHLAVQGVIWGSISLLSCVAFIVGHWINNYLHEMKRIKQTEHRHGAYGAEDPFGQRDKLCGANHMSNGQEETEPFGGPWIKPASTITCNTTLI